MPRKLTSTLGAVFLATIASTAAIAGGPTREDRLYGEIQSERDRQRTQIERGRNEGSLTFLERYSLRREQSRIEQIERNALSDGRLDRDDYRRIRQAQDDAARHIQAERHDTQVRGWWWRLWR